jgi:Tfp pilus assembly protein PilO
MASPSFIADFAKKPPIYKVGVFFGIAAVLGLLYYQLVLSSIRKDTTAAEEQRESLAAAETALKKDEREYKDLKKEHGELEKTIDDNDDALPTAAQLPAFFDMLNRKVGEASVEVRKWEYQKEIPVEDFVKVPVVIELQGTFQEIKKFFYLLYKMSQKEGDQATAPLPGAPVVATGAGSDDRDRILTIEDLKISDPEVKNNELLLIATFRASTFRQDSREPVVDEKAKAKEDKKKAKTKGGKVKDKVEDSMDKSDDRARGAGGDDADQPERTDKPEGGSDAVKKGM